jgi:hypothetical protein
LTFASGASSVGSGTALAEAVAALHAHIVATIEKMTVLSKKYLYMIDFPPNYIRNHPLIGLLREGQSKRKPG